MSKEIRFCGSVDEAPSPPGAYVIAIELADERSPNAHVTLDCRTLIRDLAAYREPNSARSMFELMITVVPFVLLWVLMWAALDAG